MACKVTQGEFQNHRLLGIPMEPTGIFKTTKISLSLFLGKGSVRGRGQQSILWIKHNKRTPDTQFLVLLNIPCNHGKSHFGFCI